MMRPSGAVSELYRELATPLLLVLLRCGGAAAAFATSLVLARTMGAADMGTALTCISLAPILAILVTGSTEAGCVRFIIAYREAGEPAKVRGMIRFNRACTLVGGVLVLALGWLLTEPLTELLAGLDTVSVMLAVTVAVLLGWVRIGAAHSLAFGRVVRSFAPTSFFRQAFLLLGLVIWSFWSSTLDVVSVMWILLGSTTIAVVLQSVSNRSLLRDVAAVAPDTSGRREWVSVGLQLGLTLAFVQFSRDITLVVGAFSLPPEGVAVLGIASAVTGLAKFGVVAINQSIVPELSRTIARGEQAAFMRKVTVSNHLKMWPTVVIFLGLLVFGERLADVFGPEFEDVAAVLLILMLEPLALAFFGPGGHYISLAGRHAVLLPLSVITLAVLCASVTAGALLDGVRGAAIGSSLTWILWSGALAVFSWRYSSYDLTFIGSMRRAWPGGTRGDGG